MLEKIRGKVRVLSSEAKWENRIEKRVLKFDTEKEGVEVQGKGWRFSELCASLCD